IGGDGIFAASFSAAGPQVAVSAPGVAVVSTVPGSGYMAADGTSVAAAHVTGLAALVLANHPLFRSEEHTSDLQSLPTISYAVFCLKKKKNTSELQSLPTISYAVYCLKKKKKK